MVRAALTDIAPDISTLCRIRDIVDREPMTGHTYKRDIAPPCCACEYIR